MATVRLLATPHKDSSVLLYPSYHHVSQIQREEKQARGHVIICIF